MDGMMNSAPTSNNSVLSGAPAADELDRRLQPVAFRAPQPPASSMYGRTRFRQFIGAAPIEEIYLAEFVIAILIGESPR
jgi:hypothetical protein